MIMHRVLTRVLLLSLLAGAFQGEPASSLTEKVKAELGLMYYDNPPPIEKKLLELGDAKSITAVLIDLATRSRDAEPPGLERLYLIESVFALGKFKATEALPLLKDLVKSRDTELRVYTVQAIAQIDAKGSRGLLLQSLGDENFAVRRAAAEGLATTNDPAILTELEVQASREQFRDTFQAIQALADAMRSRMAKSK